MHTCVRSFMRPPRFISSNHSGHLGASLVYFAASLCVFPACAFHRTALMMQACVCFSARCVFDVVLLSRPQIRKLRRELDASQEKVSALTTQLSANVSKHNTHTQHIRTHTPKQTYMYIVSFQGLLCHILTFIFSTIAVHLLSQNLI